MSTPREVYIALNKLHTKIDTINKGDNPYFQFRYLLSKNGEDCQYLHLIAKQMPIETCLPELEQLVKVYREYVTLRDNPGLRQ
jgi:hypothetical protein